MPGNLATFMVFSATWPSLSIAPLFSQTEAVKDLSESVIVKPTCKSIASPTLLLNKMLAIFVFITLSNICG